MQNIGLLSEVVSKRDLRTILAGDKPADGVRESSVVVENHHSICHAALEPMPELKLVVNEPDGDSWFSWLTDYFKD